MSTPTTSHRPPLPRHDGTCSWIGACVRLLLIACVSALAAGPAPTALAQEAEVVEEAETEDETAIRLNFPENVPLTTLIAYVSTRLDLNILYEESQVNRRITLRTPHPVPESALLELLRSVLAAHQLTLEETEIAGLMRIVPAPQMAEMARFADDEDTGVPPGVVTRMFTLRHSSTERVQAIITPLLSKPGGNVTMLPDMGVLVVTDRVGNLRRIERMVAAIDTARGEMRTTTFEPKHVPADELHQLIEPMRKSLSEASADQPREVVAISHDVRSNRLIVTGLQSDVEAVLEMARLFDMPSTLVRRVYRPKVLSPERLETLIRQTAVPEPTQTTFRAAADANQRLLVVSATAMLHQEIESLLEDVDQPPDEDEEPVRFYRLKNTVAAEVLATIRALEGRYGLSGDVDDPARTDGASQRQDRDRPLFSSSASDQDTSQERDDDVSSDGSRARLDARSSTAARRGGLGSPERDDNPVRLAVDANTNSIIVIAPPDQQRLYAQLIEQLDQRRPQVLIETSIVTMDTSGGFSLGVEVGRRTETGEGDLITFSSFGLSEADPITGRLTPGVATGANVALLSPDIADVVIKALSTHSRTRLVSMPRVLVNDNETGMLDSVSREPFERTVVTDGTTIVGEGDTAEAGTRIEITPHISEDNYLQLAYDIELSSFTGQRQSNLPPPSQSNKINSRVTIPDGHTIVVGGLNRTDLRESISGIPLLSDIPLIKHLFREESHDQVNTTLFIFIRPTILRDDQFRGLKHLSQIDRQRAEIEEDYPDSEPILIQPLPVERE